MYSKKIYPFSIFALLVLSIFIGVMSYQTQSAHKLVQSSAHIGVLVPAQHPALDAIVAGFKDSLKTRYPHGVNFDIQNAQGDANIQRTIIQQFIGKKMDIVVSIGTAATQMTAHLIKDIPIIGLASRFSDFASNPSAFSNLTGVEDEIGPVKPFDLIQKVIPNLKKLAIIYSNNEKIFPEVKELQQYASSQGISLQNLGVNNLTQLYTASRALDTKTQAVFIFKDHLVISGIHTVLKAVEKRKIPVITSDEGSVQEGAAFALGVSERAIGEQGAKLAAKILEGESVSKLPVEKPGALSVFYNPKTLRAQGIPLKNLKAIAGQLGYPVVS